MPAISSATGSVHYFSYSNKYRIINCSIIRALLIQIKASIRLLVLLAQQIVDSLDRVEGLDGHLDKDGDPVAH